MKTKKYVEYMVEETKKILAIDSPSGYTADVADYVMKAYQKLGYEPKLTTKGGVLVALGGKDKKNAVMLEAHIDTLGAMVAEIKSNGRLRVTPVGGMNANNAEAENCRIHTRFGEKVYEGTLQLANASIHVNGDYNDKKRTFDETEIVLDEKVRNTLRSRGTDVILVQGIQHTGLCQTCDIRHRINTQRDDRQYIIRTRGRPYREPAEL